MSKILASTAFAVIFSLPLLTMAHAEGGAGTNGVNPYTGQNAYEQPFQERIHRYDSRPYVMMTEPRGMMLRPGTVIVEPEFGYGGYGYDDGYGTEYGGY